MLKMRRRIPSSGSVRLVSSWAVAPGPSTAMRCSHAPIVLPFCCVQNGKHFIQYDDGLMGVEIDSLSSLHVASFSIPTH
jgi:hypothetical protein